MTDDSVLAQQDVGTSGAQAWLQGNIVPLVLLVVAIVITWHALKADNARALKAFGPVALGMFVLGVVLTDSWGTLARFLAGLFT